MKVHLVNYATPEFFGSQERLNRSAREFGVDIIHAFRPDDLRQTPFYAQHQEILDQSRGAGYWLWKPYLMLEVLRSIPEGDVLFYCDCGAEIVDDLAPLVVLCQVQDGILLFTCHGHHNSTWTKRDCFVGLDCDTARIHAAEQVIGGYQLYVQNPRSVAFVNEWLAACCRPELLTDAANDGRLPNLPDFREHRHDQSILSLLAEKHAIPRFRDPSQWGNHLKGSAYRQPGEFLDSVYSEAPWTDSPYVTTINLHRERLACEPVPIDDCIPTAARNILHIGCGDGTRGARWKRHPQIDVRGITFDAQAAKSARLVLDRVHVTDRDQIQLSNDFGQLDCIVIERFEELAEPARLLRQLADSLSPQGVCIVDVANVRHQHVLRDLLGGTWSPGRERQAVRFYTHRELEKLCYRAGFQIEQIVNCPGDGHADWVAQGRPAQVAAGPLQLGTASPADAEEFLTKRFVLKCHPAPRPDYGLTSIIVATFNQLQYTRLCVDSLRLRTDEAYELIFVDNGSTDGTPDYLASLPDVTVIRNAENRGFPAAVNQGLAVARGDQILLLNNDTVLTTGWLEKMLRSLCQDPQIGLVGPCSNNVSGPQQVPVSYRELEMLDGFAWEWGKQHAGQFVEIERLVGFCLLIRREVIEKIGDLDEQFGIGCYEDDDFCRRARQAGYRTGVAVDSFVHHFGSRTFLASGLDFGAILSENQRKYEQKWESQDSSAEKSAEPIIVGPEPVAPVASGRPQFLARRSPQGGLRLVPNDIRLSLCMIVRDNERTITPCLESIRPWVDELVIVDTGSIDRTPEIVKQFGARLFHFPWCDDFSAARNESLRHARGEWIFWMDSDDTIDPECGRQLRELAQADTAHSPMGYVMQVHCPGEEPHDVTVVDHIKLFHNRPNLRFEGRIHEQILPAIRRAGGEVAFTDVHVVHSGSEHSPETRRRKLDRDFRILRRDLEDRPDHPFVLFNLGMTSEDAGEFADAVAYLERCLAVSHREESHVGKAYALLAAAQFRAGDTEASLAACRRGLALFPADKELLFRQALALQACGKPEPAATNYTRILEESTDRHFASIDRGLASFKARHNLALVWDELQDWERAITEWSRLTRDWPQYVPGWQGLCRVLFEQRGPATAREPLEQLKILLPTDPCVWHNLGTAYLTLGEMRQAGSAFQESLRLRPDERKTAELLAQCM